MTYFMKLCNTSSVHMQAIRYAFVGLLNTAITAIVIFIAMHAGTGVYTANALGFTVGIIFSFIVNTLFTFALPLTFLRFLKFLLICFLCWLINAAVIYLFLTQFPSALYISQLTGLAAYTLSGFIMNKIWVMK